MGGKGSKDAVVAAAAVPADAGQSTTTDRAPPQMDEAAAARMDKVRTALEGRGGALPEVLKEGRYRIADQATTEAFYAQQPATVRMQAQVPKEIQGMTPEQVKRYLTDTEGLNLGAHKMTELSQQWRLLMASDAVQHGIDCGILLGVLNAGLAAIFRPAKRHPIILANHFLAAYGVGVIGFPMALLTYEQVYTARIMQEEREMFQQQRTEFYQRLTEASDARDPNRTS